MILCQFFESENWNVVEQLHIPGREGVSVDVRDLPISEKAKSTLIKLFPNGIYRHQKEALDSVTASSNVCLATGTASGKSLVFYVAALEHLIRNPKSKIIAIYPLKALAKEQEQRWRDFFTAAGVAVGIGRIDGQVPMQSRISLLKNSQLLIVTPDVIHAWLMLSLSDKAVSKFLNDIQLIIADEAHTYSGVFGSNAAYLFRRMRHIMGIMGATPQFIAASATIAEPKEHLKKLFGLDFTIIDSELDSSPKKGLTIRFVNPPQNKDLLTNLAELMDAVVKNAEHRFIAFVDSRKQTEYITSISSRLQVEEDDQFVNKFIEKLDILPYRAGYEEYDRSAIQGRLSGGTLTGVVSTSALELGIDIPYLTLGILVGVPRSATSLFQRIGRIGRHKEGDILIVNTGDIYGESIFAKPNELFSIPLSESALYLENRRIQYIHALCLARMDGEHDKICHSYGIGKEKDFHSEIEWPDGFIELCTAERAGVISTEFQGMKSQAGDDPNHTFPLRDVDLQFQVKYKKGTMEESKGTLSYGQLMREAYPGAVYYYATQPFRVYRVSPHRRVAEVRHEKRYTTKPQIMPTLIFPNFTAGNVFGAKKYGDLIIAECNLQIREAIAGYKERRGPNEIACTYPLDPTDGIYFDQPRFTRNFFTTGVVFSHPAFNQANLRNDVLANYLFETFLMAVPFERRDLQYGTDKHRLQQGPINPDDRFLCVYDQTYGSLRLSGRIMEANTLKQMAARLEMLIEIGMKDDTLRMDAATAAVLEEVLDSLRQGETILSFGTEGSTLPDGDRFIKVIQPGSKGLDIKKDNEEFFVEAVFYSPVVQGIAYRGKHLSDGRAANAGVTISIPYTSLIEIPGESRHALYDLETGELKDLPD